MTRQTLAASLNAPLSGIEAAVRFALKSLSAPRAANPALELLEAEQARVRATSRHWLLG